MSARYVIRKNGGPVEFPWEVRDGRCSNAEAHTFDIGMWSRDCYGDCNAYSTFADAVDTSDWRTP